MIIIRKILNYFKLGLVSDWLGSRLDDLSSDSSMTHRGSLGWLMTWQYI